MPTLAWSHPVENQKHWFVRRREKKCAQEDNLGAVKASRLAQELKFAVECSDRERRTIDNHDKIVSAHMTKVIEENKGWRYKSLDAFTKRKAYDQMYRSIARTDLRRKEQMVGLTSDDPREIDAQCNLYSGGSGVSKFPRQHCLEDLIDHEEKWHKKHLQRGSHRLQPPYGGVRPTAGGQWPLPTGFPTYQNARAALTMSLSSPSLLHQTCQITAPPPGTILERHHTIAN